MAAGIYRWTVSRQSKPPLVYIGQSIRLTRRKHAYETDFRRTEERRQENERLYLAVRKYGRVSALFTVLELLTSPSYDQLLVCEQHWYDYYLEIEKAGGCKIANFVRPGAPTRSNPYVSAKMNANIWTPARREQQAEINRNASPEWRAKTAESNALNKGRYYVLRAPDGRRVEVFNLRAFCREQKLDQSAMVKVYAQRAPHHKNWSAWEDGV